MRALPAIHFFLNSPSLLVPLPFLLLFLLLELQRLLLLELSFVDFLKFSAVVDGVGAGGIGGLRPHEINQN
jgi:hypothetical protein